MTIPPEEMSKITDGARLAGMLPYLEREIERMKDTTIRRGFALIREGAFTQEMAHTLFLELYSYDRLLRNITTHVKIGASVGENYKQDMEKGLNDA